MQILFHGHACFSIFTENNTHLLIDPFFTGNRLAKITADEISPAVILLTHGHWDHIGDTAHRLFGHLRTGNCNLSQEQRDQELPRYEHRRWLPI